MPKPQAIPFTHFSLVHIHFTLPKSARSDRLLHRVPLGLQQWVTESSIMQWTFDCQSKDLDFFFLTKGCGMFLRYVTVDESDSLWILSQQELKERNYVILKTSAFWASVSRPIKAQTINRCSHAKNCVDSPSQILTDYVRQYNIGIQSLDIWISIG